MFSYVTCMHIVNFTTMQLHFGSVQYMQQSNLESIHILYSAIRFLVLVLSTSNSYIKHCHLSKSTITEQGYCKAMIISWQQNEPAACIISESCGQQSQSVHKIDENFAKKLLPVRDHSPKILPSAKSKVGTLSKSLSIV